VNVIYDDDIKTDEEIFNDNVKIYLDIETINKKIFNL
jgi:hypothetical protein